MVILSSCVHVKVAENEICTLRDCLSNEKTRSTELENQLRDWQSNCCCRKGVSSEESSREEDEFRGKGSLDCEARQSTDQNEVHEQESFWRCIFGIVYYLRFSCPPFLGWFFSSIS